MYKYNENMTLAALRYDIAPPTYQTVKSNLESALTSLSRAGTALRRHSAAEARADTFRRVTVLGWLTQRSERRAFQALEGHLQDAHRYQDVASQAQDSVLAAKWMAIHRPGE